jgi:hypothetical protein
MAMILMTFVTDHNPYSNDDTIGEHRQTYYYIRSVSSLFLLFHIRFNQCSIMIVVHVVFWYVQ